MGDLHGVRLLLLAAPEGEGRSELLGYRIQFNPLSHVLTAFRPFAEIAKAGDSPVLPPVQTLRRNIAGTPSHWLVTPSLVQCCSWTWICTRGKLGPGMGVKPHCPEVVQVTLQ